MKGIRATGAWLVLALVAACGGGQTNVEKKPVVEAPAIQDIPGVQRAAVKAFTDGRGADVIFDSVGGDTFDRSRRCVAWEGRILVIGFAGGRPADAPTNHVLVKNYSVVGVHWGGYRTRDPELVQRSHAELVALWEQGRIHPLVSAERPLDEAVDALAALTGRATTGKVVLRP